MKYKKETFEGYIDMIKNSSYLHVIINKRNKTIHTINQCFKFDFDRELKQWVEDSLFTDRQIMYT